MKTEPCQPVSIIQLEQTVSKKLQQESGVFSEEDRKTLGLIVRSLDEDRDRFVSQTELEAIYLYDLDPPQSDCWRVVDDAKVHSYRSNAEYLIGERPMAALEGVDSPEDIQAYRQWQKQFRVWQVVGYAAQDLMKIPAKERFEIGEEYYLPIVRKNPKSSGKPTSPPPSDYPEGDLTLEELKESAIPLEEGGFPIKEENFSVNPNINDASMTATLGLMGLNEERIKKAIDVFKNPPTEEESPDAVDPFGSGI